MVWKIGSRTKRKSTYMRNPSVTGKAYDKGTSDDGSRNGEQRPGESKGLIAPAEPCSVVDLSRKGLYGPKSHRLNPKNYGLVLEEDAGHMIRDKVRWVVNVV